MPSQALYWRLRPYLTPGLQNSHIIYARRLQLLASQSVSWLDLGCGRRFVPEWAPFQSAALARRRIGIDPDASALHDHTGLTGGAVARGDALPFADGAFDLVTASMVLEHVSHPSRVFAEVSRVLSPGGVFLVHTPNLSGYTTALTRLVPERQRPKLAAWLQGRKTEDVYPTFYRANTRPVLEKLAADAGFEGREIESIDSSPMFAGVAPLVVPEMLFIQLLRTLDLNRLRACLLGTFRKAPG
jgi:ubiquinone/menaquinone biosynthesis C-methylase UbiE